MSNEGMTHRRKIRAKEKPEVPHPPVRSALPLRAGCCLPRRSVAETGIADISTLLQRGGNALRITQFEGLGSPANPQPWKAAPRSARILRAGSGGIPAASFWWCFHALILEAHFINTPLQRGDLRRLAARNRFNGFACAVETIETLSTRSLLSTSPPRSHRDFRISSCHFGAAVLHCAR
jgi:hypothetical protein